MKSLRKVGIVGFGIGRAADVVEARRGEEGRERKIKTPNHPSELRRAGPDRPMEGKPRKKEVRTICLAERHQLVWPVLSGTG